jgi:uncharacterized protein (DUF2141 family)
MRFDRTNKKGAICGTIVRPNRGFGYDRTRALNFSRIYRFEMRYDIILSRYASVPFQQIKRYDRTSKKGAICGTIVRPNRGFGYDRTRALNFSRIYRFQMRYDIILSRYASVPFQQIKRYDRTNKKGAICGTIVRPNRGFGYDRTRALNFSRIYRYQMRYDIILNRYARVPYIGVICGTVAYLYWYVPYLFVVDISYRIGTFSCGTLVAPFAV